MWSVCIRYVSAWWNLYHLSAGELFLNMVPCRFRLSRWYFRRAFCRHLKGILITELLLSVLNPLNAELNPICHLLILLRDLTFMGPCIVSVSNKMQRYTVYLYLETALHLSGGNSTHHQERIQLYLQHLVFVTPLLLSAAIVEELEQIADSSNGVTNTRCCRYSCMRSWWWVELPHETCRAVSRHK
jgi:hypothetical protein